jgi:hypothetical protein
VSLKGKGLWAWRLWELDKALSIAAQMQATYILYKVAQGPLPGKSPFYIDNAATIANRIRQAGLVPLAWSFTTLADPVFTVQSTLEAFADGYEGFIFNAEDATSERRAQALQAGQALMSAGVNPGKLFLCSYPTPLTHHPDIPFNELAPYCQGGLMPMAYGTYRLSPDIVVDQWTYHQNQVWMAQRGLELPIYPVLGPHFDEVGNELMTRQQFQTWLDHLAAHGPSFISLYTASLIKPEYFAPFRAFVLGPGDEPITTPVWIHRLGGGVIFGVAGQDGTQRTALPYASRLIQVGEPILTGGQPWVQVRYEDGVGWMRAEMLGAAAPPPYPDPGPPPVPPPGHLLTAETTVELNMRSAPFVRPDTLIGCTVEGARVRILQDTEQAAEWIGQMGKWLRVRLEPAGPEAWVAAWYLISTAPTPPAPTPTVRLIVHSPELGWLRVRREPTTAAPEIDRVDHGELIWALEPEEDVHRKVGQQDEWLQIRTPEGEDGYTAAWYLKIAEVTPTLDVVVKSPEVGFLRIRRGPGTDFPEVAQVDDGAVLKALEPEDEVRRKVGQREEWLHVRIPGGEEGYTAAWYLELPSVEPTPPSVTRYVVVESPEDGLRVREGAGTNFPQIWWVPHSTVLESLEDVETTQEKVGQTGRWLEVETPSRKRGFVAAWFLRFPEEPDERVPVEDQNLPLGFSAWTFGMHAASIADDHPQTQQSIRQLFESGGKRGWVLFTEATHSNPNLSFVPELRERLWDWVNQGFGVVVRLNNNYHPSGTLPRSQDYDAFAASCARWVDLYLKHDEEPEHRYNWVIQIANEQNNPSEHPGSHGHIHEHITPELYAEAFNETYAAIKGVLPHVHVAPGAVDPYNSVPFALLGNRRYRPLDYFMTMLEGITDLDAIILHAYTHGPSLEAITGTETFADPFLGDHYFNFQTYRQFAERIPARWKEVPVLIGESNHVCRPPNAPACDDANHQGWINANIGWVRALYAEVDRWNQRPYNQQIWGLLLYRWLGDRWSIHDKPQIQSDFRQAMANDYRWRA